MIQLNLFAEENGKALKEQAIRDVAGNSGRLAVLEKLGQSSVQGETLVICLDPGLQSQVRGAPNISAWPNDANVCSLSEVIEKGPVAERFYLSPRACAGILRRAEKRKRKLPAPLEQALRKTAGLASGEVTAPAENEKRKAAKVRYISDDRCSLLSFLKEEDSSGGTRHGKAAGPLLVGKEDFPN